MACLPATPWLCPEALGAMHCKGRALGMFDGILQRTASGERLTCTPSMMCFLLRPLAFSFAPLTPKNTCKVQQRQPLAAD